MSENQQTISVAVDDLSLDELVMLNQGFGHDIERLRQKRVYLNAKIAERLAKGERNAALPGDATAPGAVIDVKANG